MRLIEGRWHARLCDVATSDDHLEGLLLILLLTAAPFLLLSNYKTSSVTNAFRLPTEVEFSSYSCKYVPSYHRRDSVICEQYARAGRRLEQLNEYTRN